MANFTSSLAGRCVLIGAVAGMRSMMAPAIVISDILARSPDVPINPVLRFFGTMGAKKFSLANSAGELIFDKLPFTPSRTQTPSVVFRCLSGALAGGLLASTRASSPAFGAALGAAGSLIGTYGGHGVRKWIDDSTKLPDPLIGLTEDGVAIALGRLAVR